MTTANTLAERLRADTHSQHKAAESRQFITDLMGGKLTLPDYVSYLAQLAYVYQALEARTASVDQPAFLSDTRLNRFDSILADLQALGVNDWKGEHPALPETVAYVERIRTIPADNYPRFLAHHYTRYLGDLSGGQAIAAMVQRHYGATDEQLTFYRFAEIDKPVNYKREYRENLNGLDLTPSQEDEVIDESRATYALNSALFDALAQRVASS